MREDGVTLSEWTVKKTSEYWTLSQAILDKIRSGLLLSTGCEEAQDSMKHQSFLLVLHLHILHILRVECFFSLEELNRQSRQTSCSFANRSKAFSHVQRAACPTPSIAYKVNNCDTGLTLFFRQCSTYRPDQPCAIRPFSITPALTTALSTPLSATPGG